MENRVDMAVLELGTKVVLQHASLALLVSLGRFSRVTPRASLGRP